MKREYRGRNIGIQGVKKDIDPVTRSSEISARLRVVEEALKQVSWEPNKVQTSGDIALGRNRNDVVHEISESLSKEEKQREGTVRYHVVNLIRTVKVPELVVIKMVFLRGRLRSISGSRCRDPQPTPVDFSNPRHRNRFLVSACGMIQSPEM